nr:uncharacterized protein LOC113394469 [Vanessa tameamea]
MDASDLGWGAHLNGHLMGNLISSAMKMAQQQERAVCSNGCDQNTAALSKSHVLIQLDNRILIAYIRKEGGTRSLTLLGLTYELLTLIEQFKITLSANYILGRYHTIADRLSRKKEVAEWHLLPQATGEVFRKWGPHSFGTPEPCDRDLFDSSTGLAPDFLVARSEVQSVGSPTQST